MAVGFRFRRMRSSMLGAIERGRTPAVDFLNGEVIDHARRHRIPTPVNEAVRALVWRVAQKKETPSIHLLRRLYEERSSQKDQEAQEG